MSIVHRLSAALGALLGGIVVSSVALAEEPRGLSVMPYTEGAPIPGGYRLAPVGYSGPVIAGALMFAPLYGLSCIRGALDANSRELLIPGIGSFIAAATHRSTNADGKGLDALGLVYLANGAAQTIGLTMMIIGSSLKRDALIRADLYPPGREPVARREAGPSVAIRPGLGSVTVALRF